MKTDTMKELQSIPGVGRAVAMDLLDLGYRSVKDIRGEDPELMYVRLNDFKGQVQDICLLYTFRCVVYYVNTYGNKQDPKKLKWWNWMDKQKMTSNDKDAEIRRLKKIPPPGLANRNG